MGEASCFTVVKWVLVALAVLLAFRGESRQIGGVESAFISSPMKMKRHGAIKVCGPNLVDVLRGLCESFNTTTKPPLAEKRSLHPDYVNDGPEYEVFFPKTLGFRGVMVPRKRNLPSPGFPTGLSSECCQKRCSVTEMLEYCNGKGGYRSYDD